MSVIDPSRSSAASASNPFSPQARTTSSAGFEQQLSEALSESLSKLGVTPGTVNISIRNGGTEAPTARQILITWNPGATTTSPASPSTSTASAGTAGNPFLPSSAKRPESAAATAISTAAPDSRVPQAANSCETPWCSWGGPKDRRDQIVPGGGLVTESGAPKIELSKVAAGNQWNYSGLAAFNPYFTTPSNPLRPGYVLGFDNWFSGATITGGKNGSVPANQLYYATEEGANEALRLVQRYEPGATLGEFTFGGGPFVATKPMYYVNFPDGRQANAGLLLAGYYNHGYGVTTASEDEMARNVRSA